MFAFSSCIFASEACNFATFSGLENSLTRARLLEISAAWIEIEKAIQLTNLQIYKHKKQPNMTVYWEKKQL